MVFLAKNRGEKLKDSKKKLQKLIEKPSATSLPSVPPSPQPQPQSQLQSQSQPIQFSVKTPTPKLPPSLQLQPSAALSPTLSSSKPAPLPSPMAAAPWWVSDVTFIVEGKKIPGHRVVLQSRSEFFTRFFQTNTQEVVTLEITDFSHHIFSQFVRWVYGGKKEIALEDAADLARCALHYQAAELVSICHKILEEASLAAAATSASSPPSPSLSPLPLAHQSTGLSASPSMDEDVNMQMDDASSLPLDTHNDPVIPQSHHQGEMIEFIGSTLSEAHQDPYSGDYVSADAQSPDFGFGMNMWSNDPVLFPSSESNDAFRIMEIC